PLLAIYDGSLLHLAGLLLNLLQHDCAEKMRIVLLEWSIEHPVRNAHDVIPEWLPLVLFVPHIRALEQGDHKSLGLHENHLGRANLSFHRPTPSPQVMLSIQNRNAAMTRTSRLFEARASFKNYDSKMFLEQIEPTENSILDQRREMVGNLARDAA